MSKKEHEIIHNQDEEQNEELYSNCRITDCFDCENADSCPIIQELYLKYFKKNGVNHYVPEQNGEVNHRNVLNELTGAQWLYFTKTLLTTSYSKKYAHELRKAHGANKPPELMKYLIEFFTKRDGRVLDPFAGVGGTLIGAAISNPPRDCVGIEINPEWINIYDQAIKKCNDVEDLNVNKYEIIQGDCLETLGNYEDCSFQFIATDPPYNLQLKKTMCTGNYKSFNNRQTDYNMISEEPKDLANLKSYEDYLDTIEQVLGECWRVLEKKKYMAIILRNAYQNSEYIYTHADIAKRGKKQGFVPKGEIVWYQSGTRLRPYGYPFAYVPNIAHQYIVILQKP